MAWGPQPNYQPGASTTEEVNPFVKRVVTVNPDDLVIFRLTVPISQGQMADIKADLEVKMGAIPFLVIGPDIDLTVLKQSANKSQVHIA